MNVVYIKEFENSSIYIGVTNDFDRRMGEHERHARNGKNRRLYNTMNKYSHTTEILMEFSDYDMALNYEYLILESFKDLGYDTLNLKNGGHGGLLSDETKQKISNANRGKVRSEEHRAIISKSHKGKKLSEETKQKMRDTRKGIRYYDNSKDKDFYWVNPVYRYDFKTRCKTHGWDYNMFIEVLAPKETWKARNTGGFRKRYFYIHVEEVM